jgi:hypothetical protein
MASSALSGVAVARARLSGVDEDNEAAGLLRVAVFGGW